MEDKLEYLDENLEEAYRQAEFDELCDYYMAVRAGHIVEDPRPKMSFITNAIEEKAKAYASCLFNLIEDFDGTIEEGR